MGEAVKWLGVLNREAKLNESERLAQEYKAMFEVATLAALTLDTLPRSLHTCLNPRL